MKKIFSTLCLILTMTCFGQINTDRPTQSYSPFVLPQSKVQTELGFLTERPNASADTYNVTYLNALVRVGVLDWFEVRVVENYLGAREGGESVNGLSPTTLGAKFKIADESNGLPQIGLLTSLTLANGHSGFDDGETVQDIRVLFQNSLSDQFSLAYNVGTYWSKSSNSVGIYTLTFGYAASDKISVFAEPHGFFSKGTAADHRFNAGGTVLVNDNFQADLSAGIGLSKISPDYFLGFGASFLF